MIRGLIALDIDGTLTDDPKHIPEKTEKYLASLVEKGWQVMFLTGRSFTFGAPPLKNFAFPFYFGTQNGAALFYMPEKKVLQEHFLSREKVIALEEIFLRHEISFLVYSGEKLGDFIYFRPSQFSVEEREYILFFERFARAPFRQIETFEELDQPAFPMIKAFGSFELMQEIYSALEGDPDIAATLVQDPFSSSGGFYLLINARDATKGGVLEDLIRIDVEKEKRRPYVIAAGDGGNDISMFKVADFAIAMGTAREDVKSHADMVTGSAEDQAIIEALKKVIADHE